MYSRKAVQFLFIGTKPNNQRSEGSIKDEESTEVVVFQH